MNVASGTRSQLALAVHAAEDKKAENIAILQMDKSSSAFTDYFLITSGSNPKQVQAIADEIELRLKRAGNYPNSMEGYKQAEWILIDYVHFVVHVFTESARKFYDLERLWKAAKRLTVAELGRAVPAGRAAAPAGAKTAARRKPAKSPASRATGKAIRAATSRTRAVAKKTAKKTSSRSGTKSRPKKKK
jgi:ribosome-associated protein